MKLFPLIVFTFFFASFSFSETSPRITSTLSLGQIDHIQASDGTSYESFGEIVAIEGDTVLIGVPEQNNKTGAVYVYTYNKTTALYEQVSKITASNAAEGDKFGAALAISDGLIIIGAPYADHGGENRGLMYLLRKPDTGWTDIVCDYYWGSPSENNNDFFGKSITLDSHTLAVSAPGDNGYRGAVFVYEKGEEVLTYKGALTASDSTNSSDEIHSEYFGHSLAIRNDTIVVGSTHKKINGDFGVGAVYVYVKASSHWSNQTENAKLTPSVYTDSDCFGTGITIDGDTIAVVPASSNRGNGLYIFDKPVSGWANATENYLLRESGIEIINSVAFLNNSIVVGVRKPYSTYKGAAYIYKKISGKWTKHKKITPYNPLQNNFFGDAIAIDGKNIVIGAIGTSRGKGSAYIFGDILTENSIENKKYIMMINDDDDNNPSYHYSVLPGEDGDFFTFGLGYGNLKFVNNPDFENPLSSNGNNIYTARIQLDDASATIRAYHIAVRVSDVVDEGAPKKAMSFSELNKLKASNSSTNAKFGYSVAIDGTTAVVGAYNLSEYHLGLGYVYELNTTTHKYEQVAILSSFYEGMDQHLGISVAIKDNIIVLGADKYLYKISDTNYIETGAALVYVKPENGWENAEESYTLYAYDKAPNDHFGKSVAINDNVIVVGSPDDDDNGENTGSVYIFDIKNLASLYTPTLALAKLTSFANFENSHFGESIAVDEDTIVVGAPQTDTHYNVDIGWVYLYKKPLLGWASTDQFSTYLDPDAHAGDMFGYSVAIANDIIAASSVHDDNGNGSVYLFKKPIYSWNNYYHSIANIAKLTASDAHPAAFFGSSIAMNTHSIVIGSQSADDTNGAVYLFDKPASGWINAHENKKLINTNREEETFFGCSVAMSGKTIIAGSYGEDHAKGSALIFYTDNDEDGITNDLDPDDDNDGVLDVNDAFPNDPSESIDTDHDGIGNNADLDDDNDGIEDTLEIANGLDPLDPSDAETDLDNDGFSNAIEIIAGSDIRDAASKPIWAPIMMGDILIFIPYFAI